MMIAIQMISTGGEADPAAALMVVDGIVRIRGQLGVEPYGMALQADHGLHRAEVGHLRGGVPRGP